MKRILQFHQIAQGSTAELETQLIISYNLQLIKAKECEEILFDLDGILRMLSKLHQSLVNVTVPNE